MRYKINYSPDAVSHLEALSARQRRIIIDAVDEQLRYEPTVQTRQRKVMKPNPMAPWELRVGDLRIYYDVSRPPRTSVWIRGIGIKDRNRVIVAGKVVEL